MSTLNALAPKFVAVGNPINADVLAPRTGGSSRPEWCRRELVGEILGNLTGQGGTGGSCGAVVVGAPGAGKTFLARKALERLDHSYLVVQVEGRSAPATTPYGALESLVNNLDEGCLDHPLKVVAGLTRLLRDRAGGREVVLFVDDAEGLDELAALVVNRLTVHGTVRLLATGQDLLAAPGELVALWKDGVVGRTDVGAYSRAEARQWLRSFCAAEVSAAAAAAFWAASRGNPRVLELIVRDQMDAGTFVADDGIWVLTNSSFVDGANSRDAVCAWLNPESRAERQVLELLALSGGMPLDSLLQLGSAEAVDSLTARGCLDRPSGRRSLVRLGNPLAERAIRERVPRRRSRELYLRAAQVQPGAEGSAAEVLAMSRWALDCGEPLSAREAREASCLANRAGQPRVALRFAELLAPHEPGTALVLQARAYLALGEAVKAEQLLSPHDLDAMDLSLACWVEAMLVRSHVLASCPGRGPEARAELDRVEVRLNGAEAGSVQDGAGTAALREDLALATAELDFSEGRYRQATEALVRLYPACTDRGRMVHAATLLWQAWTIAGRRADARTLIQDMQVRFTAEELAEVGAKTTEQALLYRFVGTSPVPRLLGGPDAGQGAGGTAAVAVALGELGQGVLDAYCGRAERALTRLLPAQRQLGQLDTSGGQALAGAAIAYCYALLGKKDKALQFLVSVELDGRCPSQLSLGVRSFFQVLASAELASKEKAGVRLLGLAEEERRRGAKLPELVLLCAAVRQGCHGAAPRLVAASASVQGVFADVCRLFGTGVQEQDSAVLLEAAEAAAGMGDDLFARDAAREAQKLAATAGDRAAARAARHRISSSVQKLGVMPTEEDGPTLTAREQEVARRAAAGESNKAIAAKMHISVRTVEGHLYQIYGKLLVTSRADLKMTFA
ncbi:LuxR C-terminal-related transcriptional regulator [Arthrobacter sp. Hor0625]|uniref:LuxR C-terminal-related transcriptional regulator n=1 Tax=Arthrobacter sp. Hor0625 TaxID=3457358 RepID=UPI00403ECA9B